jgi:Uma2 family endonuclease
MKLHSLREYVLVSQDERRIEVFRRPDGRGHWDRLLARAGETIALAGETIAVDEIYAP